MRDFNLQQPRRHLKAPKEAAVSCLDEFPEFGTGPNISEGQQTSEVVFTQHDLLLFHLSPQLGATQTMLPPQLEPDE